MMAFATACEAQVEIPRRQGQCRVPPSGPGGGDPGGKLAKLHTQQIAAALALINQDRPVDAMVQIECAAAIADRSGDPRQQTVSDYLRSLADDGLGDYVASERAARRGLGRSADGELLGILQTRLGSALHEQGRFDEALEAFAHAVAAHEAYGNQEFERTDALMMMAVLRSEQHLYTEGEALYRQSIAVAERGGFTLAAETARANLGWNLHQQGRLDEADPLLREAVASTLAAEGPVSRNLAAVTTNLAGNLQAQGRDAEALPLFRQALSLFEQTVGRKHSQVGWTLNRMARSIGLVEGPEAAEPFFREAVELSAAQLPPGHPEYVGMVGDLARHLIGMHREGEALALLRPAGAALRARRSSQLGSTQTAREFDRLRGLHRLEVEAVWALASQALPGRDPVGMSASPP